MNQVGMELQQDQQVWSRHPKRLWKDGQSKGELPLSTPLHAFPADSLVCRMAQGNEKVALSFAGQGHLDLDDMARIYHRAAIVRETVEAATESLRQMSQLPEVRWSGVFGQGVELKTWLESPALRPSVEYLKSPLISQLVIFVHQVSRYRMLYQEGLSEAFLAGSICGVTGHSQGILPALLIAQSQGGAIEKERFACCLRYLFWQGLSMALGLTAWRGPSTTTSTPMASVSGPDEARLQELLDQLNHKLPASEQVVISLYNTHTRHVLSGSPKALSLVQQTLESIAQREAKQKQAGKRGGKNLTAQWDYLDTSGPYHSPAMGDALQMMQQKLKEEKFRLSASALIYDVYSPATGKRYNIQEGDILEGLLLEQFVLPVQWHRTVTAMAAAGKPTFWLDFGPGDGVLRLTYATLKGMGVSAISVANQSTEDNLFSANPTLPHTLDYQSFAPRLRPSESDSLRVENRFTEATGLAPVILPGMTPTTADVPIVAAAANAGFVSELAGGGQVTEAIFWQRMDELRDALEPGREIVFNSLYMDRYLWDLHCGKTNLVGRARQAGYPICGITVSAGIPDVEEAVELLDTWKSQGIWLNAFKPGTLAQIKQVARIAKAAPHHDIFVHLEGGKAGGHHSWESLDDLLLDGYHILREQANVILCVGGGIGTNERAVSLLKGDWSLPYARPRMPVDAVFVGTLAMACLEACTSPQVKQALVAAKGTPAWVPTGKVDGHLTSGKSQLNADIHYIDNAASRCGRLLDQVAGDLQAVTDRRTEIIEALNATAKPFFGELTEMTYAQVAARLVALLARGRGGTYEDGTWIDRSYRTRCFDFLQRAEARLSIEQEGTLVSFLKGLDELDQPQFALERFHQAFPKALTTAMHPADIDHFYHQICARPGKPVNFVPVIDADVRRWYKSDSLWQAHDDRYEAEQVLIIPGPEAVAGLDRVDEPIASLLGRMNHALLQNLLDHPTHTDDQPFSLQHKEALDLPEGLRIRREKHATWLEVRGPNPVDWLAYLSRRWSGPIAALARIPHVSLGTKIIPNPLQQLCIPTPGACLHIETDQDDEIIALRYQTQQTDQSGQQAESLSLYPEDTSPNSPLRMSIQVASIPGTPPSQMGFSIIPSTQQQGQFQIEELAYKKSIKALYQCQAPVTNAAVDASVETLLIPRKAESCISAMQARGYVQCTEGIAPKDGELPLNMAFSMVWEPLLQLLTSEALVGGMLQLVHLDHQVTPGAGWPLRAGQSYEAKAAVTRIEDKENGRLVRITATLSQDEQCCATVASGFLIRGNFAHTAIAVKAIEDVEETITPQEQGAIDYLVGHPWLTLAEGIQLQAGQALRMTLQLQERRMRRGMATYTAQGKLWRDGKCIGDIELTETGKATQHPLRVCLAQWKADGPGHNPRPAATLSRTEAEAPRDLRGFAAASGDLNPIHQSTLIARLAGLEGPIVHGMWTAARLHSFVLDTLADGQASRCKAYQASFLAPVLPGEPLRLEASRVAVKDACLVIQATAQVYRGDSWERAVQAEATITPPKTAYVFPGQGIQQAQMGMAGYARSADARAVWEQADAYTRSTLGFSILHIVRDNPKELLVKGKSHIHPKGVLHLTQFTQVAMAVLAQAQIAELRGAGMLAQDAIICGHSVGEYNAIGAMGILPLQDIVEIVYQRGMVMHDLVPRDASGESGYRMAVLRPHYAGMDHKAAERLVAKIQSETGGFLEIVNYNVRDRQYAVTGDITALTALQKSVEAMATGSKSPYLEVPGIDVPFHSSRLRAGVDHFRETLDRRFPKIIDLDKLCGKYIPNLVPRPFTLERDFIEEIVATTDSPILTALLQSQDLDELEPHVLGRILLIELLAWQFTSPVRWIETQELLLHPDHIGGLGVTSIIEVGVGYQPTLANMARYSLRLMGPFAPQVSILNADAETDQVFQRHTPTDLPAWRERQPNTTLDTPSRPGMPHQEAHSMILSAASREAMEAALRQQQAVSQPAAVAAEAHIAAPITGPTTLADQQALQQALTADEALLCLLALQAKVRPEQIAMDETLDDLFAGVSSRRNQVLLDMGAEFAMTPIDGAHEIALKDLCATLRQRCPNYQAPGPYLKGAQDEAIKRTLGPVGLSRKELLDYLTSTFQAGHGLSQAILNTWTLDIREGKSGRGGSLGKQSATIATKAAAWKSLDLAVAAVGQAKGLTIAKPQEASSGASAVDAAVVEALEAKILGPHGILQKSAEGLLQRLQPNTQGQAIDPAAAIATQQAAQLALYEAEFAPDYHKELQPCFDPRKHVALTSAWSSHRRDLSDLYFQIANGRWDQATIERETARLSRICHTPILCKTAAWYAKQAAATGNMALAQTMAMLAEGKQIPTPPIAPTRPQIQLTQEGTWEYSEAPLDADLSPRHQYNQFVDGLWSDPTRPFVTIGDCGDKDSVYQEILRKMATSPLAFTGRTAVVTGASPNSIALACVALLLRGGAQVVVTTSTYNPERIALYRKLYEREASLDAELHIVPFNQASQQDVDALVSWLFGTETEQDGAHIRVCKRPFAPDLLLPFAAVKDLATLDRLQARSHTVMRAMLLNVERMLAAIGATYRERGVPAQAMHVLLPLSPNHGTFGGDGVYAETKAALEVLCNKWHSERDAWSAAISLCAARIGWVRGTGLMDENNLVAPALEATQGIRTFSSDEMGLLLTALCAPELRHTAQKAPLQADLTGGFASIRNLKETVSNLRKELEDNARQRRMTHQMWAEEHKQLGVSDTAPALVQALPNWPMLTQSIATTHPEATWPSQSATLADTIVLVGAGELGPCGSSRTRYQLEVEATLAPAAILELAWMTGLIQYQNTGKPGWIDTETKDSIPESEIATRYRDAVSERVGIRMAEPEGLGFDPAALPVMASVYLEQDLHFTVASQEEADAFLQAAPDTTRCYFDPSTEQWQVTRLAGTEIRVPRQARLQRQVVGSIPQGFAFQRYGITQDMVDNIDRLTLFNLVATIDAFVSAGLTPEELMTWMHPARVANTQGSGIGGMQSLHRLYLDHFTGTERQGDQLQETLINVVAAHVVQSYIGSYGAMAHPVAACATAAVSLEEGMDKLRLGKADFVVTGGYDDLGIEGMVGFSDMNATANTDQMTAMGLTPAQMSRGNDARRRGFVEAQGGGTILMTRGDIAARMGLPVLGVLAYTGSFGDGIHKSIPAPGLGALAAVSGGKQSPLAWALGRHGLSTDDIALVYKHDTSTAANDPNENRLHHTIQETLERTEGNPLYVVSQKSLTGHAKGGAAAWQAIGLCQALQHGVIPGNRNLDCVDEEMRTFHHMGFTNKSLHPGQAVTMRAGLLTSLGFGHVSGIALVLHPASFLAMLSEEEREAYQQQVAQREEAARHQWASILMAQSPAYQRQNHRRFAAEDGSPAQITQEIQMLLNPESRLDLQQGHFIQPKSSQPQ